jgi:hypothetical protein
MVDRCACQGMHTYPLSCVTCPPGPRPGHRRHGRTSPRPAAAPVPGGTGRDRGCRVTVRRPVSAPVSCQEHGRVPPLWRSACREVPGTSRCRPRGTAPSRLSHRYRHDHPAYPVPARCLPGGWPARGVLTRCGTGPPLPARCGTGPEFTRPGAAQGQNSPGPVRHRAAIPARQASANPPARTPAGRTAVISAIRAADPETLNPAAERHPDNTGRATGREVPRQPR